MKLLIHGDIQTGKSTRLRRLLQQWNWTAPRGYFTHWGGEGRGAPVIWMDAWTPDSIRRPFARRPGTAHGIEHYQLDAAAFEEGWKQAFSGDASRPLVIDELGLLELSHPDIVQRIADEIIRADQFCGVVQARTLEAWLPHLAAAGLTLVGPNDSVPSNA